MEDKLYELEMKICFLEDYLTQMNNIIIQQGNKIEKLIEVNNNMKQKLSLIEENIKEPLENTPPPHY